MCPISGGNWNNTTNAGVWALNLNNVRTNSNNNVGFRSDSVSPHIRQRNSGTKGGAFLRATAKSAGRAISSRAPRRLDRQGCGL